MAFSYQVSRLLRCTRQLHTGTLARTRVIDLRSDVLTMPTPGMYEAMTSAPLGDDVFRDCPTTEGLQKRCADLFEMEDSLFVPSGTMGNLLCLMAHCTERGSEIIVGDQTHIYLFEQGGAAQLAGVHSRSIGHDQSTGEYDLHDLEKKIRTPTNDPHLPLTKLICLENTLNDAGGLVIKPDYFEKVGEIADRYGLQTHLDGARVMNASAALGIDVKEITSKVDSVNMCFSKGLGTPVGSIIAGTAELIDKARRFRKAVGGALRQPGVLTGGASYALDTSPALLPRTHENARLLADVIDQYGGDLVKIKKENIHTNIVMIYLTDASKINSAQFSDRCAQVKAGEKEGVGAEISLKLIPFYSETVCRLVTYLNNTDEEIQMAAAKLKYVLNELNH